MRGLFPEYYALPEEDFSKLWDGCLFILDTNILLNLYRYSPKTRGKFFEFLNRLSSRLWLPHQVAKEYQHQRLNVIVEETFEKSPLELSDELYNRIMDELNSRIKEYEQLFQNDTIRPIIDSLYENKIGLPFSQQDLEEIFKKGEKRYSNNIPPGYEDARIKKDNQKFGDLILWYQIMRDAREKGKPIILITDDRKEDWWWIHHGKTSGPRPELIKEFLSETNMTLHIYNSNRFVDFAEKYFNLKADREASKEIERIASEIYKPMFMKMGAYTYSMDEKDPDEEKMIQIITKIRKKLKEMPGITEEQAKLISSQIAGKYGEEHELYIEFHN
jgi:hypothetical protein